MPTRTDVAKALALATTILASSGSGLGSNNTLATGSRIITVAGNAFGSRILPDKTNATITNEDNPLKKEITLIAKLDIKDFFNSPSKDLSQHDSKPATPEQQQAYIQKNKEQLLMLGMLGIQSTNNADLDTPDIKNYNGKITIMLSKAISFPYIPDIFSEMDSKTKKLMADIDSSKEFQELQRETFRLFFEQKRFNEDEMRKYHNSLSEVEKKFLQSDEVKSDTKVTEDGIKKNSAPQDKSRNSSATQLSNTNEAGRPL